MQEITTEDAKRFKIHAQQEILKILRDLEDRTGMGVNEAYLSRFEEEGYGNTKTVVSLNFQIILAI